MRFNNNSNSNNGKAGLEYASTSFNGVDRSRYSRINEELNAPPTSITTESSASTLDGVFRYMPSHRPALPYSLTGLSLSSSPVGSPSDPNYLVSILENVIEIVNQDIFDDDNGDESLTHSKEDKQ